MKSKISFFNAGLFKSTLRRFWPLWFIHFGGWFLFMPVLTLFNSMGKSKSIDFVFDITRQAVFASPIVSCLMAIITAMAVFSFMYNSRSTGLISSLPLRRETVFGSVWIGGVAAVICSNFVIALLSFVFSLGAVSDTAFAFKAVMIWFGVYSMQFLLFFGIATITAVMTGSIVVLPVLFFIFNFFAVIMEYIVRMHFSCLIWGMANFSFDSVLDFLSPVVYMLGNFRLDSLYDYNHLSNVQTLVAVTYSHWTATVIYCAVGLLLSAAALLIFRKRRMEAAGDVIAVRCLKPVFKYGVTACSALCGGMLLYTLLYAIFNNPSLSVVIMIPSLIIFALVGYFGARMLLEKSLHVFHDGWVGIIIVCCLCAVFTLGCDLDVFGIGRYIPDESSIECMSVSESGEIRSKDGISEFRALHESILKDRDKYTDPDIFYKDTETFCFVYTLKNGRQIIREYTVLSGDENYEKYYELLNSPVFTLERFTPSIPVDAEHCTYSEFTTPDYEIGSFPLTSEQAADFYHNALVPDIMAGRYIASSISGTGYLATITMELAERNDNTGDFHYTSLTCEINIASTSCIAWVKDKLGIDLLNLSEYVEAEDLIED